MYKCVSCRPQHERVNVVANLPYNITKMALRQMLPLSDRISHLHFMLQASGCHMFRLVAAAISD